MELVDTCEACLRLKYELPPPKRTGRKPKSFIDGLCMRGHKMYWDTHSNPPRWRCKPCEVVYAGRRRLKREASR